MRNELDLINSSGSSSKHFLSRFCSGEEAWELILHIEWFLFKKTQNSDAKDWFILELGYSFMWSATTTFCLFVNKTSMARGAGKKGKWTLDLWFSQLSDFKEWFSCCQRRTSSAKSIYFWKYNFLIELYFALIFRKLKGIPFIIIMKIWQ